MKDNSKYNENDKDFLVLCDLDNVLNNLTEAWINELNQAHNLNIKLSDVTQWDMQYAFPSLTKTAVYNPLYDSNFIWQLKPIVNGFQYIKQLINEGCEVKIVTASNLHTISIKYDWLRNWFKKLINIDIIYDDIIVTSNKQLLKADVLIDDCEENLIGGDYEKILLDYPWNRGIDMMEFAEDIWRCENWTQIYNLITKFKRIKER